VSKNTTTLTRYQNAQRELDKAHAAGEQLVGKRFSRYQLHFSFFRDALSAGWHRGINLAVIFSAAMSSTSGEINSLATVTVIDIIAATSTRMQRIVTI